MGLNEEKILYKNMGLKVRRKYYIRTWNMGLKVRRKYYIRT